MKVFLAFVSIIVMSAFILMLVAIWYLMVPSTRARADELYRVPAICKPLADKYGVPDRVNTGEAMRLIGELDRYSWWPGVKQCRRAVQREWKL